MEPSDIAKMHQRVCIVCMLHIVAKKRTLTTAVVPLFGPELLIDPNGGITLLLFTSWHPCAIRNLLRRRSLVVFCMSGYLVEW